MESLLDNDLAIPMALLLAQERQGIVFPYKADVDLEDKRHLKLISKLYDQVRHCCRLLLDVSAGTTRTVH